jgi:hypothetical protein
MTDLNTLDFVDVSDTHALTGILYGPAKQGKTTGALSAPKPILYVNADRKSAGRFARRHHGADGILEVEFKGRPTMELVERKARTNEEGFKTIVVDTGGRAFDRVMQDIAGLSPQIQHWGQVQTLFERWIAALCRSGLNFVLVCHEGIDDQEDEPLRQPQIGGKKFPAKVMGLVEVIGYCGFVEGGTSEEGETVPDRYMAQLVQRNGRRAGDATGVLGKTRELDLSEWVETIASEYGDDSSDLPWDPEESARIDAETAAAEAAIEAGVDETMSLLNEAKT